MAKEKTQEEVRKKAHAGLLAMQKSMGKKTGLSLAARNARAAHSSAETKTKPKSPPSKTKVKLTWWEKRLAGGRTKAIEEGQGPGGVKSDVVKRAERAARKAK